MNEDDRKMFFAKHSQFFFELSKYDKDEYLKVLMENPSIFTNNILEMKHHECHSLAAVICIIGSANYKEMIKDCTQEQILHIRYLMQSIVKFCSRRASNSTVPSPRPHSNQPPKGDGKGRKR